MLLTCIQGSLKCLMQGASPASLWIVNLFFGPTDSVEGMVVGTRASRGL